MIDLAAIEALRSHNLSTLFTQSLNWSAPNLAVEPVFPLNQTCVPVARRDTLTAWQVVLTDKTRFTPTLRYQLYSAICARQQSLTSKTDSETTAPLLIIVDALKTRSLWCSSASESALYVVGQPTALWEIRLRRLAIGGGLYPSSPNDDGTGESSSRFKALLVQLRESIHGIEDIAHRQSYAALTLRRLMLIQQIQQKGWLVGDEWYLQSRFSQWLQCQDETSSFFEACLQPLYQSLALPKIERPVALQTLIGEVPFLGGLFDTHQLEGAYAQISIEDAALEDVLGWLGEQMSADGLNPWLSGAPGNWLNCSVSDWPGRNSTCEGNGRWSGDLAMGWAVCDRTLDSLIQQRIERTSESCRNSPSHQTTAQTPEPLARPPKLQTLNERLFTADVWLCRRLIQDVLPTLRILDPACGSGHLLVAFHQRLTEIFSILTGHIQQNQDAQLKIWQAGLVEMPEDAETAEPAENFVQVFQKRILSNLLYGVDISEDAVESARLYLLMHLAQTATHPIEIEPLLDLDFNLLTGNALMGFITVDEERFDQINRAGSERILQGNLLQPLAADSYQIILSEKNIALEHYQSKTVLLAETHNVPSYARAALLKEEILALDQKAQKKLDALLLNYMEQQLGIRYRITQLADKPRHRPLAQQDIERLQPFHFGYHFNAIVRAGGFDIVACYPPHGTFHPTVADFIQQFPTLTTEANINEKTFKTSKPALAKADPKVSAAWMSYRDQFACVSDYFRRSELYAYQKSTVKEKGRSQLAIERLFVERCLHLLNPDGLGMAVVPATSFKAATAIRLCQMLRNSEGFGEFVYDAKSSEMLVMVWSKATVD